MFMGGVLFLFWKYEDEIIALVISEINKKANSEIRVAEVDLSLRKFPDLSVRFTDMVIAGSHNPDDTLGYFKSLYCSFRFWNVIDRNYRIREIAVEDGGFFMKRWGDLTNYQIWKSSGGESESSESFGFDVEKIALSNLEFSYELPVDSQLYKIQIHQLAAGLALNDSDLLIRLKGDLRSDEITVKENTFAVETPFQLNTEVIYALQEKTLDIERALFTLFDSELRARGRIGADDFSLAVEGRQFNIKNLTSLLPENLTRDWASYQSRGDVHFQAELSGNYDEEIPLIAIDFGCNNARFYHPKLEESFTHVSLKGRYTNGAQRSGKTSRLSLKDVSGELDGRKFNGNFDLKNFEDRLISMDLTADLNIGSLIRFFPIKSVSEASGSLRADIQFEGRIDDLEKINRLGNISSSGEIQLEQLDFKLKDVALSFDDFHGHFLFRDDAVAISDFSGRISNSDFLINGFFKNILAYLLFKEAPLIVQADLKSDRIMMGELLSGTANPTPQQAYRFRISPRLDIDFNCDVDYLEFKRFQATDIRGGLQVKDQKAVSNGISFHTIGGKMNLHGSLDARKEKAIEIFTTTRLERIDIDRLFYVFENFNQDFLTDKHLKGQIYADINTYMKLDDRLRLDAEELISDIEISIRNGELNHFEPMKKLSRYVEEKSLERLRFSDIKNQILVQNKKIYLPQMEVSSNITKIRVSGKHTFDQDIDYHVVTPIKRFNKKDKDERFGAIRDDGKGNLHLFLKIQGTTQDYKVSYDGEAWRDNFTQNIKEEGKELKEAFQNKGLPDKKAITEVNDEEFFDF